VSVQQKSGKEVFSDVARVSVYAPLSIHPPSLVLAPGAKYLVSSFSLKLLINFGSVSCCCLMEFQINARDLTELCSDLVPSIHTMAMRTN